MKLSIIIVNYNVEHFLEQCILSAQKACIGINAEIIVVDNASVDGSLAMMADRFPDVHLIANTDNKGFSKANNQGIKASSGEYILLLNPDTVVEEETFKTCIAFMDARPEAGGLGVRMLDGKGNFLPESKRGLPTPEVAFYKIFGLSSLFPKSKRFGRYHLGNLSEHENHEVEILSGAFMFMRKTALDKVGLLDEDYFMYGEDIDLSYRIIKGGYKNFYTADTRIIHYKGESTKKTSVNYVLVFYNAMRIFARKHFSAQHANSYNKLIELAIYARAGLSIVKRFIQRILHPMVDFALILFALWLASTFYETKTGVAFISSFIKVGLPVYTLIWVVSAFLSSGYEFPLKGRRKVQGVLIGTGIILILYSLLPEEFRFSRAIILIGTLIAIVLMLVSNFVLKRFSKNASLSENSKRRFLILGSDSEQDRIAQMMYALGIDESEILTKNPLGANLGFPQIKSITEVHNIDEIIFCAKDLSSEVIIDYMSKLDSARLDYKIAPPESMFIIGSNSKDNSGDFLTIEMNTIGKPVNIRNKRLLDIFISAILLISLPVMIFLQKRSIGFLKNIFSVFFGFKTWVGYHPDKEENQQLPLLKRCVIHPDTGQAISRDQKKKSNILYAKDYSLSRDIDTILANWRNLGD